MKFSLLGLFIFALLIGCRDNPNTGERGGGGSREGAGGAGPGYEGSSQGTGKVGTVPTPGSGIGADLTNSNSSTNH